MTGEVRKNTVYEPGDHPSDIALVNQINAILHEHYPGHSWAVDIPPEQNIVKVLNLTLDPRGQVGMICHKDKIDVNLRSIVRVAGELLERFNVRRGKHDPADVEGKVMHFARADDDPRLKKPSAKIKAKHGGADG